MTYQLIQSVTHHGKLTALKQGQFAQGGGGKIGQTVKGCFTFTLFKWGKRREQRVGRDQ